MTWIYLDNNATTRIAPEAAEAVADCLRRGLANPASQHGPGRLARRVLEEARLQIGRCLGAQVDQAPGDRVILTSSGTEANNLALRGLLGPPPAQLVISAVEHPSVAATAEWLSGQGYQVRRIPVDRDGVIRLDRLDQLLAEGARLVSVMLANHETGVIQPVEEVVRRCRAAGALAHVDAVQAVGKMDVDFRRLGADALTASAHKAHGPAGVGVLVLRRQAPLRPILFGGGQQAGLRPGTEPVCLAAGMARALALWRADAEQLYERMRRLRDRLERLLAAGAGEGLVVVGRRAPRLPHATNIAFAGVDRQALLMALDQQRVACSSGPACASLASNRSPVLEAMGVEPEVIRGAVRLSVSRYTTMAEVEEAAARILLAVNRLRRRPAAGESGSSARGQAPKPL